MSTQHTPGPWNRNIRAGGKYPTVFAGRNQHVAVATQQKDPAETEANIDLIAAAPDLLAALRYVEIRRQDYGASNYISAEYALAELHRVVNDIRATARAAIAQAEGR